MPNSNKYRSEVNNLEALLRSHTDRLVTDTATRFANVLSSMNGPSLAVAEITAGARYTHDLIVVAAALYPSDITLRNEWNWATTGTLVRYGIGYEHFAAMLQTYFGAAADLLPDEIKDKQILDILEAFVTKSLKIAFNQPT